MHVHDKENRDDDFQCFFQPDIVKCSNLDFVLRSIIVNRLDWISVIYTESILKHGTVIEEIDIPEISRNITIACKRKTCVFEDNLEIKASIYRKYLTIYIENITFKSTNIILYNVNIQFKNVNFINTNITDKPVFEKVSQIREIVLTFYQVNFVCNTIDCSSGLSFKICQYIMLHIYDSSLKKYNVITNTFYLLILIQNSLIDLHESAIILHAYTMISGKITNVTIENQSLELHSQAIMISSTKITVEIFACLIQNTYGGIIFNKTQYGAFMSWLQVKIKQSRFVNNTKLGSGGAININFYLTLMKSFSHVSIESSTFVNNRVSRWASEAAHGGGLFITAAESDPHKILNLHMEIKSCQFVNNKASDGGGAIFAAQNKFHLSILNTSFSVDDEAYVSTKAIFILFHSDISIQNSTFTYQLYDETASLVQLEMYQEATEIHLLDLVVKCLPWHKLSVVDDFKIAHFTGELALQKFISRCLSCPLSFYVPTNGLFSVLHQSNTSEITINSMTKSKSLKCLDCPYGGECTGNQVKPKPNFWGNKDNGTIIFHKCPTEYCCSGRQSSPCTTYNTCSGNRAGNLCGRCKEGYSLSIFSNICMNNRQCKVSWIWAAILMSVIVYMLWYTFKDDILLLPSLFLGKVLNFKRKFGSSIDTDIDKGYFGIMSYYVQAAAMMRISVSLDKTNILTNIVQEIEKYIGLILSIELSYFSYDLCPFTGLTTSNKHIFKILFLSGIFVSWFIVFSSVKLTQRVLKRKYRERYTSFITTFELKFIKGLIEIIKYTYGGFSGVAFMSLTCVSMISGQFWFYDGTVRCLSNWQIAMGIFCIVYLLPFPLMLINGMELLGNRSISETHFLCGCIVPLPFLILWLIKILRKGYFHDINKVHIMGNNETDHTAQNVDFDGNVKDASPVNKEIINCFQSAYIESHRGSKYWESVMILRRLLLGATALIPNATIQMACCVYLSQMFLIHHIYVKPFKNSISNTVETISLTLLTLVSIINLSKSYYIHMGVNLDGPNVNIFVSLRLIESSFIIFLVCFIILCEIRTWGKDIAICKN